MRVQTPNPPRSALPLGSSKNLGGSGRALCRPVGADILTVFCRGCHPCLWSVSPFRAKGVYRRVAVSKAPSCDLQTAELRSAKCRVVINLLSIPRAMPWAGCLLAFPYPERCPGLVACWPFRPSIGHMRIIILIVRCRVLSLFKGFYGGDRGEGCIFAPPKCAVVTVGRPTKNWKT